MTAWCGAAGAPARPTTPHYHDHEWGRPVGDDTRLFEKLCLEGFQAGLSWLTILRKREAFRAAFAGFDLARVARFGARDVRRLLGDAGIVRHRGKIESTINNARRAQELIAEVGSLAAFAWGFEPPARERPRRMTLGRAAAADRVGVVAGAGARAAPAWLHLRRPDHQLRLHAGDGVGQRSPRRLRGAAGGGGGAGQVRAADA
jgi:DNA-3-methyladenine glycosylase I